MVFDKAIVLIEHRPNNEFSIWVCEKESSNWVCFYDEIDDFQQAKYLVKLIKVAFEWHGHKGIDEVKKKSALMQLFATEKIDNPRKLTAKQLLKKMSDAAGSL